MNWTRTDLAGTGLSRDTNRYQTVRRVLGLNEAYVAARQRSRRWGEDALDHVEDVDPDSIPADAPGLDDLIDGGRLLRAALNLLGDREHMAVIAAVKGGRGAFADLAPEMGVTRQRCLQIRDDGLERLRLWFER